MTTLCYFTTRVINDVKSQVSRKMGLLVREISRGSKNKAISPSYISDVYFHCYKTACCICVAVCHLRNVNQIISKHGAGALNLLFSKHRREFNWILCFFPGCIVASCQICPVGLQLVPSWLRCASPSPLLCLPPALETGHVGSHQRGESLSQRHRLHPPGETAQPTRGESTRDTLAEQFKKMACVCPPKFLRPSWGKPSITSLPGCCVERLVQHLVHMPWALSHTTMLKCDQPFSCSDLLCAPEKRGFSKFSMADGNNKRDLP